MIAWWVEVCLWWCLKLQGLVIWRLVCCSSCGLDDWFPFKGCIWLWFVRSRVGGSGEGGWGRGILGRFMCVVLVWGGVSGCGGSVGCCSCGGGSSCCCVIGSCCGWVCRGGFVLCCVLSRW